MVCDKTSATLLILLDLSAAFDTVDQEKLLQILQNALRWFKSFLCSRTQKVKIQEVYSSIETLLYGVPQGSVLGPVLFNIYIRSLYQPVQSLGFDIEGFADDHQLRLQFNPIFQIRSLGHKIQQCFDVISNWMNQYFLRLNAEKTKILVICSPTVRNEILIKGTFINGKCIRFVSNAKNIGVIIDEELNFDYHINKVTSSLVSPAQIRLNTYIGWRSKNVLLSKFW